MTLSLVKPTLSSSLASLFFSFFTILCHLSFHKKYKSTSQDLWKSLWCYGWNIMDLPMSLKRMPLCRGFLSMNIALICGFLNNFIFSSISCIFLLNFLLYDLFLFPLKFVFWFLYKDCLLCIYIFYAENLLNLLIVWWW